MPLIGYSNSFGIVVSRMYHNLSQSVISCVCVRAKGEGDTYIYIYEVGSTYTWCNFYKVTHFLYRRFLRDLTVKKKKSLNILLFTLLIVLPN